VILSNLKRNYRFMNQSTSSTPSPAPNPIATEVTEPALKKPKSEDGRNSPRDIICLDFSEDSDSDALKPKEGSHPSRPIDIEPFDYDNVKSVIDVDSYKSKSFAKYSDPFGASSSSSRKGGGSKVKFGSMVCNNVNRCYFLNLVKR
jgi:hypothetical protein